MISKFHENYTKHRVKNVNRRRKNKNRQHFPPCKNIINSCIPQGVNTGINKDSDVKMTPKWYQNSMKIISNIAQKTTGEATNETKKTSNRIILYIPHSAVPSKTFTKTLQFGLASTVVQQSKQRNKEKHINANIHQLWNNSVAVLAVIRTHLFNKLAPLFVAISQL